MSASTNDNVQYRLKNMHEVKKEILVHGLFLIKYSFED